MNAKRKRLGFPNRKRPLSERLERSSNLRVSTMKEGVEMRRICVWCNQWEQDIKSWDHPSPWSCTAPDGDGHLFRLHPVVSEGRDGAG